jgi:hypothetical protein
MKKVSSYLLGLMLAVTVASCSKDNPAPAPTVSAKATLLTSPKWRITAIATSSTIGGQALPGGDGFTNQPACVKDDYIKFNTDLTAVKDEGASKCSTSSPQSRPATWSFNAAETELTTVDPSIPAGSLGNTIVAEVLQLNATTLQVRTTNSQNLGGTTYVVIATTTYAAF